MLTSLTLMLLVSVNFHCWYQYSQIEMKHRQSMILLKIQVAYVSMFNVAGVSTTK